MGKELSVVQVSWMLASKSLSIPIWRENYFSKYDINKNAHVRLLVGWSVFLFFGPSVCHNFPKGGEAT